MTLASVIDHVITARTAGTSFTVSLPGTGPITIPPAIPTQSRTSLFRCHQPVLLNVSHTSKESTRYLSLDGLRGTALLMVLAFHRYGVDPAPPSANIFERLFAAACSWGLSGVDLFFVLSGFLITGILLKTRHSPNFYRSFYMRRVLRIFPLYYLAVFLTFILMPRMADYHCGLGLCAAHIPFRTQVWFWLNVSNFKSAFNPWVVPLLIHFWSLAIEEQFYLFWPAVVRFFTDRTLAWIIAAGALLPLILRTTIPSYGPDFYYRITPFHMEGLFVGAGLALIGTQRWKWGIVGSFASVGVACSAHWPALVNARYTFLAVLFGSILGVCLQGGWMADIFSLPFLRLIGKYSYFMYIFHLWVFTYVQMAFTDLSRQTYLSGNVISLGQTVVDLVVLYGLSVLSWKLIEGPVLRLKQFFPYRESAAR